MDKIAEVTRAFEELDRSKTGIGSIVFWIFMQILKKAINALDENQKPRMVKRKIEGWIVFRNRRHEIIYRRQRIWERNNLGVKRIVPVVGEYEEAEPWRN